MVTKPRHIHLGRTTFLAILLLVSLLPILWTTLISLNVQPDNSQSPPIWSWPPSLQNYIEVHDMQTYFWQELATSLVISGTVTILTGCVSLLAAYALANTAFRGRNLLIHSFLILASLPAISYAIPLGLSLRQWHLFDTAGGVILAESAGLAPLAVFILIGFVSQVPRDLESEARLNGAELQQILRYVVLPAVAPGLLATCALIFVLSWNQYVVPLVLSGTHIRVIPVMLRDFFALERDFEWPAAAAVILISLLPVGSFVAAVHRILEHFSLVTIIDPQA
ncbi:MAG: ABC transporter permease subunit [Anaerolineaceae bacterium]|nr:ABC transporter permease subunit [Anaerolineaceae bacterium]